MPWEHGAARSAHFAISAAGELLLSFWYMYDLCICHFLSCTCTTIFEWRGYTNYLWLGNGDIRSIYICFCFSFCLFHFGVRRPGLWESRTIVYIGVCPITVSIHIIVDDDGYYLIGVGLLWTILICICIIGGWDWPGVGIGVPIRIDCLISSIRRPVPIFGPGGLLSVK